MIWTTRFANDTAQNLTPLPRLRRKRIVKHREVELLIVVGAAILLELCLGIVGARLRWDLSLVCSLYFLVVVTVAMQSNFWTASLVSLVAVGCEEYFIAPPAYDWRIGSPREALAIFLFEASALLICRLATEKQRYFVEMENQRQRLQKLFALTSESLKIDPSTSPEQRIAELVLEQFDLDSVLIFSEAEQSFGISGRWVGIDPNHLLKETLAQLEPGMDAAVQKLQLHGATVRGQVVLEGDIRRSTLPPLGALISLVLERHKSYLEAGKAEAARHAEQLRVTVLDSLAHAFKTPLTVIRAASSSLTESERLTESQNELARLIDENAAKMTDLATRLLQTAHIHAEDVVLDFQLVDIGVLLNDVVAHANRNHEHSLAFLPKSRPIQLSLPLMALKVPADYNLLRATLTELVENAVKYSQESKSVTVKAWDGGKDVVLSVHSWSGVIPRDESESIFQRFYRGSSHSHSSVPGTGLGLSIARATTDVHEGEIWLHSEQDSGTTFYISLPKNRLAYGDGTVGQRH